jgi:peptidoglycan/LPS O-acetylase OafA/YrhL
VVRKYLRLYPSAIIAIVIGWFCCNLHQQWDTQYYTIWGNSFWQEPVSLKSLMYTLTLILPFNSNLINPPIWYLQIETRIALMMPILIAVISRYGIKLLVVLLLLCTIFCSYLPFGLGALYYYLSGLLARYVIEKTNIKSWILQSSLFTRSALTIMGLLFLDIFNITRSDNAYIICLYNGLQCIGSMIILIIAYLKGGKILNNIWLVRLGNISYQLYLLHFIIMLSLRPLNLNVIEITLLTICISIPFSIALYRIDNKIQKILPFNKK